MKLRAAWENCEVVVVDLEIFHSTRSSERQDFGPVRQNFEKRRDKCKADENTLLSLRTILSDFLAAAA